MRQKYVLRVLQSILDYITIGATGSKKATSPKTTDLEDSIMTEGAEVKPRAPKTQVLPKDDSTVLRVDAEKVAKYKGQRAEKAAVLRDGMTYGEFTAAGGDKGFLSFYIKDGAVTVG